MKNARSVFVGKTLFFIKERVLVVGDLHLGYEKALYSRGLEVPLKQLEETKIELEKTITHIKAKFGKPEWIIFLGDVKHSFSFIGEEKKSLNDIFNFLKKHFEESKIIFIRGNHEKNYKDPRFLDYFILKDMAFVHGNKEFLEIYDKAINIIVMGHLHPTVTLRDKMKIKTEKYKCFLVGRYKKKDFMVVPSFLGITEGVSANEFEDKGYDYSIVPNKELGEFEVFVASELGEEALGFGKLKDIK